MYLKRKCPWTLPVNFCSNSPRAIALENKNKRIHFVFFYKDQSLNFNEKKLIFYFKRKCQWILPVNFSSNSPRPLALKKKKQTNSFCFCFKGRSLHLNKKKLILYFKRKCQWTFPANFSSNSPRAIALENKNKRIHFVFFYKDQSLNFNEKKLILYFKRKCPWTLPVNFSSNSPRAIALKKKTNEFILFLFYKIRCYISTKKKLIFYFKRECEWTPPPSEISVSISQGVKHSK